MERRQFKVQLGSAEISVLTFIRSSSSIANIKSSYKPRRLLLLHGAGVAGELTWGFVANYLQGWDEILIPDLPAMGDSSFNSKIDPVVSIQQGNGVQLYIDTVLELIEYLKWSDFSLAGYSFGGLLSLHLQKYYSLRSLALIEPASLLSLNELHLKKRGSIYLEMGRRIISSPDSATGFLKFLNLVSPATKRDDATSIVAIKRLMANPLGLACGVMAVGDALQANASTYIGWSSDVPGCSFVGGLSGDLMKERHKKLALDSEGWLYHEVPNADHGLIYTRPRQIARLMDASLHSGWE